MASEYTSISCKTLYDWSLSSKIPSMKVNGKRLFDLRDLDKFMESLKSGPEEIEKATKAIVDKILN